jgi:hypothetical protein
MKLLILITVYSLKGHQKESGDSALHFIIKIKLKSRIKIGIRDLIQSTKNLEKMVREY